MQKIIQDPALLTELQRLTGELELRDEAGNLLGYFLPPARHRELFEAWARSPVTDDELDRARGQAGGRTLPEILKRLQGA